MKTDRLPQIGDMIGCSDGDIGVVLSTYWKSSSVSPDDSYMVKIAWSKCGKTLVDPWCSQDFNTSQGLFYIASRA